ncbi:MAG: class I tRNA ligase family protein, partial [Candidatus Staskawiczbacteria bacterium]|nr:class I tRNA ligase family protein [Candidatus Staskawiczbacteria bacterium]
DDAVDMEFGTGVVKVTPAHDQVDFDMWQRHQDEIQGPIQVIDKYGKLNELTGKYQGMKVKEARDKIAEEMTEKRFLNPAKTDHNYKHNVALCYKCGNIIEPMVLDNQWFVKMTAKPKFGKLSLRDAAVKAVKDKKIVFVPKRMEKVFLHWMKNLRDWNISRQITWGIPIPGDESGQVFDTWFSSGQWPFATLKSTRKGDFEKFYPTDVMETGWDILFFWIARMVMLGIYATEKVPFKTVYLHGLVRDKERQKMSKSKGNVIDPLGVVDLYGTDALRMALVVGNTPGNDPVIYEEKIKGYRNFATKIWNASRFVLMNLEGYKPNSKVLLNTKDKKLIKDFQKVAKEITKEMDEFKFYVASEKIYHYFWHTFCDKIIEEQKLRLYPSANSGQVDKKPARNASPARQPEGSHGGGHSDAGRE